MGLFDDYDNENFDGYDNEDDYEDDGDDEVDLASALDMLQSLKQSGFDPYPNLHGAEDTTNKLRLIESLTEIDNMPGADTPEQLAAALEILDLMQKTGMIPDDMVDEFETTKSIFESGLYSGNNQSFKNSTSDIPDNIAAKLKKLQLMRDNGIMSEEKFAKKKAELLGQL